MLHHTIDACEWLISTHIYACARNPHFEKHVFVKLTFFFDCKNEPVQGK